MMCVGQVVRRRLGLLLLLLVARHARQGRHGHVEDVDEGVGRTPPEVVNWTFTQSPPDVVVELAAGEGRFASVGEGLPCRRRRRREGR
jgi:hypothetical protein